MREFIVTYESDKHSIKADVVFSEIDMATMNPHIVDFFNRFEDVYKLTVYSRKHVRFNIVTIEDKQK